MAIKLLTINGYPHLYRSLIRFLHLETYETRRLLHLLYTANYDSYRDMNPLHNIQEVDLALFCTRMLSRARPYRTEVQLFKSMECLNANICIANITREQKDAVKTLRYHQTTIDLHFVKSFGVDITDPQTTYADCAFSLIPRKSEPYVCLARFHEPNVMIS